MRKYQLYTTGICTVVVLGIRECALNIDTSSGTTTATQESQEASKEEATVEGTTVVESVTGAIESMEESQAGALQSIHIYGPVAKMEDGRLSIDNQSGMSNSGKIILSVSSDAIYILDAVTGLPIKVEDIEDGEAVYAHIGPAMTMSPPPMTNAEVIFTSTSADAKVPGFVEVKSMIADVATSKFVLTTVNDTEYTLAPDYNMFPYFTGNIITLGDLTQRRKYVVWPDDDNVTVKIMVLAEQIQI